MNECDGGVNVSVTANGSLQTEVVLFLSTIENGDSGESLFAYEMAKKLIGHCYIMYTFGLLHVYIFHLFIMFQWMFSTNV